MSDKNTQATSLLVLFAAGFSASYCHCLWSPEVLRVTAVCVGLANSNGTGRVLESSSVGPVFHSSIDRINLGGANSLLHVLGIWCSWDNSNRKRNHTSNSNGNRK